MFQNCEFNVKPGEPAFSVFTNRCDYFCIGQQAGDDVWLEGRQVEGEFIFNGRLFMHDGSGGTVIDSFPKAQTPDGWTQKRHIDGSGYSLVDPRGETVFGYRLVGKDCVVEVDLHCKNGEAAVHGGQGGLVVEVPVQLGTSGMVIAAASRPGDAHIVTPLPGLPGGKPLK